MYCLFILKNGELLKKIILYEKRYNFLLTDEKQSGKIIFVAEENGQAVKKTDYSFKRKIKMFLTKYDSL